jgi:hypothetical protein
MTRAKGQPCHAEPVEAQLNYIPTNSTYMVNITTNINYFKMVKLFFILAILVSNACFAQKIEGKYFYKGIVDGGGRSIEFSDGKFTDIELGHMNSQKVGKGTYQVIGSILKLNYLAQINPDTSTFSIEENTNNSKTAFVELKVYDENNNPTPAWIVLINQKGQKVATIIADANTGCNMMPGPEISALNVEFIGYVSTRIAVKKLSGKNSKIIVNLHPITKIYTQPSQLNFTIKKITDNSIILNSKKDGDLVLTK